MIELKNSGTGVIKQIKSTTSTGRMTINSSSPVVVMTINISVSQGSKVRLSGVLVGTFNFSSGIVLYKDNTALGNVSGTNIINDDVIFSNYLFAGSNNSRMHCIPFDFTTDTLNAGNYDFKVATLTYNSNTVYTSYINNRGSNDMASMSTFTVQEIN